MELRIQVEVTGDRAEAVIDRAKGVAVFFPITAWSEDPTLPFDVQFVVAPDSDGTMRCRELLCRRRDDGGPVNDGNLRRLPLGQLVKEAVVRAAMPIDVSDERINLDLMAEDVSAADLASVFKRRVSRSGPRPDDDDLREVARIYRTAKERGIPPTKAVTEAMQPTISRSTAGRWVMLARERGFLGKAMYRKAGEVEQ